MIVSKKEVMKQLSRLNVGGLIGEAVLEDALASRAVTTNHDLYVRAKPLEGVQPLPEPVGVLDLSLLNRAIGSLTDDDEGQVSLEFQDNRIFIGEKNSARIRLATGQTTLIGTQIERENSDGIEALFAEIEGVPLPNSTVQGVLSNVRLLKAEALTLEVTAKGSVFVVGKRTSDSHYAEVDLPSLKVAKKADEYLLHLPVGVFTAVLDQVTDFTRTVFQVTGPESMVAVRDHQFLYALSPLVD